MSDRKVTIDIETRKTGSGASDSKKEIESLGGGAKSAEASVSASFQKMQSAVGKVTGAVGALRNLFTGFGIAQAAVAVIGQFRAIKAAIDDAKKAQDDLVAGLAAIKEEMAAGFTAKTVDDLTLSLKRANDEIERLEARRKAETEARRTAEDAASGLAEQRELAAIDPSDPLAAQKAGEVRAKYASQRGQSAAARRLADTAEESRRMDRERASLLEQAAAKDAESKLLGKDAEAERAKARDIRGEGDKLVLPPWWKMWAIPEADPKRQLEAAKSARGIEKGAEGIDAKADEARREAEALRRKADAMLDLLGQMETVRGAAYQGVEQARIAGSAGRRSAAAATEQARHGIVGAARGEREKEYAVYISQYEKDEAEARKLDAAAEYRSAESGYAAALGRRGGARAPRGGLGGRWGSDGRIRTSDDLAAEAEAAAASAERAVQAAAARLRAAKANFERLEAAVKTQRDGD